ncbi:MAG: hypothetical protein PHC61_09660 [Chitinivibrionales bacterium]|nr:hypothetical protein [Chitinivibrionales bacterium]
MLNAVINRLIIFFLFALFCLQAGHAQSGQINLNGWDIATDTYGNILSMKFRDPPTTLKIESCFTFSIIDGYKPAEGSILFLDGGSQKMTKGLPSGGELRSYWEMCGGFHTEWEYYGRLNRVIAFSSPKNADVKNFSGIFCRVETATGTELFGVVSSNGTRDGITVKTPNPRIPPVPVFFGECRSIEMLAISQDKRRLRFVPSEAKGMSGK